MFYIWYKLRLYRDSTHTTEQTCNSYFCYLGRLCTCRPWCCGHNCRWEMCWTAEQCSILRWCCVLQWSHPWVPCCLCLQLHPPFGGYQIQRMSKKWKLEWYCSTVCCWLVICHLLCAEPLQYGWSNQSLSAHNFITLCNVSVPYKTFFCLFVQSVQHCIAMPEEGPIYAGPETLHKAMKFCALKDWFDYLFTNTLI